jgi:hypothetical protein
VAAEIDMTRELIEENARLRAEIARLLSERRNR